ncbi:MAG: sugar transferase [Lachnospiraceae bacterium]|nr:sugar transferase [Lachnospiraceae bacterium]
MRTDKYKYRNICGIIATLIPVVIFVPVWMNFIIHHNQTGHLLGLANIGMALIAYTAVIYLMYRMLGGYNIGVDRRLNVVTAQSIAILITNMLEIFVSSAITGQFRFAPIFIREYFLVWIWQALFTSLFTAKAISVYRKRFPALSVLKIRGIHSLDIDNKIGQRPDKYRIDEEISCGEDERVLIDRINAHDAVLFDDIPRDMQDMLIKLCYAQGKRVYMSPSLADIIRKASDDINLFDTPLYLCRNTGLNSLERFVKRAFDIIFSLVFAALASPVMLATAIAIKLEDKGKVFFRQERITIDERRFMMIKFRSMIEDAEKDGRPIPAGVEDDRITRVGRIIRRYRIDELPQLFNIIKGDMSLVGPRPERTEHYEKYVEDIPEFRFRQRVKGGLTGYAQVYGRYNTTALDKLKMDMIYITNYSILTDIQIFFETIKVLFQKESTEGFSEERREEMHG